jgi:hypothetical protein
VSLAQSALPQAGLLEKLLAAVRLEFRADVLLPSPEDPVLGWKPCPAAGCGRAIHENGMCTAHGIRWRKRGCPEITQFLVDPGPPLRGRTELGHCTVGGCRYGVSGKGLCARHRDK